FRLSLKIPHGWSVQDSESLRRIRQLGNTAVAGTNKTVGAMLNATQSTSPILFAAYEHPLGTPRAAPNSGVVIFVLELAPQELKGIPKTETGRDVIIRAKEFAESSSQTKVWYSPEIRRK